MQKTVKKTICPLDCPDSCGLLATVEDDRVVSLAGDREHPYTRGVICRKMRRYPVRVAPENRILYPAVRSGAKGEGVFTRVSWEEALSVVAEKFQEIVETFGGEAILPYVYAGNMGYLNRFAGYPLFHKLGSTRIIETICSAAAGAGWESQCGAAPGSPPEVAADAELIVAWGINIKVSNVHFWPYVTAARKRGARLLVIDPYRNQTAQSADIHCRVKPAGDVALALGMVKSLLEQNRINRESLRQNSSGSVFFLETVQSTDWGQLEDESGVSRQEIESLASLLASTPKTFIRIGIGMTRNSRGGMGVRSILSLAACLNLFSGDSGAGVLLSSKAFRGDMSRLTHPELMEGNTRKVNMIHLAHALTRLSPPIKGLFVYNSNPVSAVPDGSLLRKGLLRKDLFTVVHEQVMTPTAQFADVLFPATTFLENRDLYTSYGHFYLGCADPVVSPPGEARSNTDLFRGLSRAMGFEESPLHSTDEERLRDYLSTVEGIGEDVDLESVLKGKLVLSTRSRVGRSVFSKGEQFRFISEDVQGVKDCARLIPAGEYDDPDLSARYPFRLISPPHPDLLNSTFGDLFPGRKGEVMIHPDDGLAAGITDGQSVILENGRGRVERIGRITENTSPGLLVAEGVFWPVKGADAINDLTSQKEADMGRGATFHECRVNLRQSGNEQTLS